MTDDAAFEALCAFVVARGVTVSARVLEPDTPALFDGGTILVNQTYELHERIYYVVHSFGSIVGWAADYEGTVRMFAALREAKRDKDAARVEAAIGPFRAFEERSSEYAVTVLGAIGATDHIAAFSEFFRADLEAITRFHRTGRLPIWQDAWETWQRELAQGRRAPRPFLPRPLPGSDLVEIEPQVVKRGVDAGERP